MVYYAARNGEIIGSHERAEFDAMIRAGVYGPSDHYWHDGMDDWLPIEGWVVEATATAPAAEEPVHRRRAPILQGLTSPIESPVQEKITPPAKVEATAEVAPEPRNASLIPADSGATLPPASVRPSETILLPSEVTPATSSGKSRKSRSPKKASFKQRRQSEIARSPGSTATADAPPPNIEAGGDKPSSSPEGVATLPDSTSQNQPSPPTLVQSLSPPVEKTSRVAGPHPMLPEDVIAPKADTTPVPSLHPQETAVPPSATPSLALATLPQALVAPTPTPPSQEVSPSSSGLRNVIRSSSLPTVSPPPPAREVAKALAAALFGAVFALALLYPYLDFLSHSPKSAAASHAYAFPPHHPVHNPLPATALRTSAEELLASAEVFQTGTGVTADQGHALDLFRQAAEAGSARAQWLLGKRYRDGAGVMRDNAEAAKWLRMAAEQGQPEAESMLAFMYHSGQGVAKDEKESLRWYQKAADLGNADAAYFVGTAFQLGLGTSPDQKEAASWFRKAAAKNHPLAQFALGQACLKGHGAGKDEKSAFHWFQKAAQQGYFAAQFAVGQACLLGEGTPRDPAEAVKWFRLAADQGDVDAQKKMGDLLREGEGLPRDLAAALTWYQKAADQGDSQAQFAMGRAFLCGEGIAENPSLAAQWMQKAADQGHITAQAVLGDLHRKGKGMARNDAEAFSLYKSAAEAGFAIAQAALADMYRKGEGVPKDDKEAFTWYQRAAEGGHTHSMLALAQAFEAGRGTKQSDSQALKWYRQAAEAGDPDAQYLLGFEYDNGKAGSKDPANAIKWYRRAALQGDKGGQSQVGFKYLLGVGVPKDLVQAHFWLSLASGKDESITLTDAIQQIESQMNASQLAEAKRLAAAFLPKPEPSGARQDPDAPLFTSMRPIPVAVIVDDTTTPYPPAAPIKSHLLNFGTGFLIDSFGHILTSQHVIEGAATIRVRLGNGSEWKARLVRTDAATGLAMLAIPGGNYPSLLLEAHTTATRKGANVFTIGFPSIDDPAGIQPKLTQGKISGISGAHDNSRDLQASLAILPGNAGGALLDTRGGVLGMLLPPLAQDRGQQHDQPKPLDTCYALKSSEALTFIDAAFDAKGLLPQPPEMPEDKFPAVPPTEVIELAKQASVLVLADG